ncbi:hypothetical protein MMC17_001789 [Xylographa soralifera]|nr:hypothetical protein [Xylographa soralifera]
MDKQKHLMDITKFIVSHRNEALLVGDYGSYRKQLSRRLLTVNQRLGRASPKGRKYAPKPPISAQDVAGNSEFIALLLLTAERAWAHSLHMKSMHSADSSAKDITGSTRTHIISRLRKAQQTAAHLVEVLRSSKDEQNISQILLEARAYYCMLLGSSCFESQKWENCLKAYSEAHLIYKWLARSRGANQGDPFSELLTSTVDPSIRYAAYQLQLSRTLSITTIVARYLPSDSNYVQEVLKQDPDLLKDVPSSTKRSSDGITKDLPKTISWRSRTVTIEDANIAQALAAASIAEQKLTSSLSANSEQPVKERAGAYDEVLLPSQDAVNATKTAIDELTADGVAQGDQRMQGLQITRTAVNYALVGWRIGRNRVLCGRGDGAHLDPELNRRPKRSREDSEPMATSTESSSKRIARLRERVALYDTILQSLDSVKELPGVAADQIFLEELGTKRLYFASLRCLAIARSHNISGNSKNALALYARALNYSSNLPSQADSDSTSEKPLNIEVTENQANSLHHLLEGLVAQHRALVEIETLNADTAKLEKSTAPGSLPMIERLDDYPVNGADLSNLVVYPPRLRPIPVKPIFLDVAWTYIDYPGRAKKRQEVANGAPEVAIERVDEKKEGRKGWFGFGR